MNIVSNQAQVSFKKDDVNFVVKSNFVDVVKLNFVYKPKINIKQACCTCNCSNCKNYYPPQIMIER